LKSANKFFALIPDVDFITFNNEADLAKITTRTAGIVLETIQGGAGFIQPHNDFFEVSIWKNGKKLGFQNYDVPDVVVMGKRNGWRNACGRFYRINRNDLLSDNQNWDISLLGHPVIASACLALLEITETDLMPEL
jgi:4-aminobutyrate aminotransferase-like enzyme